MDHYGELWAVVSHSALILSVKVLRHVKKVLKLFLNSLLQRTRAKRVWDRSELILRSQTLPQQDFYYTGIFSVYFGSRLNWVCVCGITCSHLSMQVSSSYSRFSSCRPQNMSVCVCVCSASHLECCYHCTQDSFYPKGSEKKWSL